MESTARGTIHRINELLANKEVSCNELTKKYLDEIEKSDLNAYVTVCPDEALKAADKVDAKIKSGEKLSTLEGVPMTLKDNISTKGIETTCCSKILKGYKPIYNATVWEFLRNSGAVLLGKTNMDEFAMGSSCENSCIGGAKNPRNKAYVTGGSSGGVASAVCGNIAAYGLGSDTGGSVRQPASFCGVVGLKPTYGTVSRYGLIAYASSFDQIGPIAQTTEDAAVVFDSIAKYDFRDSTSVPGDHAGVCANLKNDINGLKIGIPKEYYDGIDNEVKACLENAMKEYESMGATIEYFDLPEIKYALPVYYILACAEASSNLARFDSVRYGYRAQHYKDINEMICKTRSEGFGAEVKRRILLGNYVLSSGYYDAYYKKAQNLRALIINAFKSAFEKYDVLLTPTSPVTAFPINKTYGSPEEIYLADICTVPVNIAGIPAVSVPCGVDSKNLPVGMQIIGPMFGETKILNAAHQYEILTDYRNNKTVETGVRL
jgi:aspartyl-tRNA(Asn)/glutamyl-tRNA(Gln) amidotransferase subunit A